jgi:hypothetical protein
VQWLVVRRTRGQACHQPDWGQGTQGNGIERCAAGIGRLGPLTLGMKSRDCGVMGNGTLLQGLGVVTRVVGESSTRGV